MGDKEYRPEGEDLIVCLIRREVTREILGIY